MNHLEHPRAKLCCLLVLLVCSALTLVACQNAPATPAAENNATGQAEVPPATEEPVAATPESVAEPDPPLQPAWQYDIEQLLAEADAALAADRLTTPIENNAFDRYNAVLILQPDNQRAINGLQEIFERYLLLAQDALRSGQFGKARALVERARGVIPDSPMLDTLTEDIARQQRERARSQPQLQFNPDQKEVALNIDGLNRRDDAMIEQLQSLAMQVREADETLLIIARSDAEGRWIYQQMAEGVPDYRLRGDIRLGREPKVLLLPPIE